MYKLNFVVNIDDDCFYEEAISHLTIERNFIPQIGMSIFLPHNYFDILKKSVKADEYELSEDIVLENCFKVIDVIHSFNYDDQSFTIVISN